MITANDVQEPRGAVAPPRAHGGRNPVVILNLYHSGLGIARDFAGSGIRVIGLSADKSCFGNYSRFCETRLAPNSQREPDELVSYLLSTANEFSGAVIFPTRDADVVLLDKYREQLSQHYILAIPPSECLQKVLDKNALAQIAYAEGVPVPRTVMIQDRSELARVADEVGFPCVVKPVSSVDWREGDNWELVGGRKAFRVENWAELSDGYTQVSAATPVVLAQEWIPGGTESIVVMAGYVDEHSEPLAFFTGRKLLQLPPDFGTGCAVASEAIPELHEPTVRLWKALKYHGMAEVEYKFDARSGEYKLIEINTRHWDQHRLGHASGINLSWTAYQDLTGNAEIPKGLPTQNATWIAEDVLAYHVLRALYNRELHFSDLVRILRGRKLYGILSWRDPMPFLHQAFSLAGSLVSGVFAAVRGRRRRNG